MLSLGDLIQLGGYAAVEYCGGPQMLFKMNRIDLEHYEEDNLIDHPAEDKFYNSLTAARLQAMNFEPKEYVALMGGVHTLGFNGPARKGPFTRWTMNPYVFNNDYFKELMREEQKYYRSENDKKLFETSEHKVWIEAYAQDGDLFLENYAAAHVKMAEQGNDFLLSELNENAEGYVEASRYAGFTAEMNDDDFEHEKLAEASEVAHKKQNHTMPERHDDHH